MMKFQGMKFLAMKTCLFLTAGLLVFWATGCGEGETLPLVPASGTYDRPMDSHWRTLSPLCSNQLQLDSVWIPGEIACVVGSHGLVLAKQGDFPFVRENPGTDSDLHSVAANSSGILIAVGENGTVAERYFTGWTSQQLPGVGDLNTVVTAGTEAWAVGDAGAVVRRDTAGNWESLSGGPSSSLSGVAVKGDTLAVSGEGGVLQIRIQSQWVDLSDGPWLDSSVHSVAWLDDGRLLVAADEFYLGWDHQWEIPELAEDYDLGTGFRMKYAAGRLWLVTTTRGIVRIDPTGEIWPWTRFSLYKASSVGVADANNTLLVSRDGYLVWQVDDTTEVYDPAGKSSLNLFHFTNGTVGVYDRIGLLIPGPRGLEYVQEFPAEDIEMNFGPNCLAGNSLDDYYLAENNQVFHLIEGQANLELTLDDVNPREMELDALGRLYLSTDLGIFRWDGSQLVETLVIYEDFSWPELFRTSLGTLLARYDHNTYFLTERGWVPIQDYSIFAAGEIAPGDLLLLEGNSPTTFQIRRLGVGLLAEGLFCPDLLNDQIRFRGGTDNHRGLYMYTRYPSLTFRVEGNPLRGNCELVAGPIEGEIRELEIMTDGALLIRTANPTTLRLYPAR